MRKPPSYNWVCFSCRAANPPGASVCAACGGSAFVSGAKLKSAQETLPDEKPSDSTTSQSPPSVILSVSVGLYLLLGAAVSISQQKWPVFMPPQLDAIALLSGIFGTAASAYIAGAIAGILGIASLVFGYHAARSDA
jgi:ribosomal protein L40E